MKFKIRGTIDFKTQKTTIEKIVDAESEKHAIHLFKSRYGSKNKVSRAYITVDEITLI